LKRIAFALAIGLVFVAMLIITGASAQTYNFTDTTVADTPTPTPTPWTTPTAIPTPEGLGYQGRGQLGALSLPSLDDFQGAIDVISDTTDNVDLIVNTIDTRLDVNVLKVRGYSPFAFARAILILLDDFQWLGILFWWFIAAFCVIMSVTAIRLVVSLWGIIDRIISLIKLIPFIGVLFFVFVAQPAPAHAQTATPPPTPTATPIPDHIVKDYHFIYPQTSASDTQWTPAGGASWSFSKYTVPVSGTISQYVNPSALAGTHPFSVTIKAQAATTSTFGITTGGVQHTFTITRVGNLARTYYYTAMFAIPTTVTVETLSGGPIQFDAVSLEAQDIISTQSEWIGPGEHGQVIPRSLSLADFADWFSPIETHPVFTWDITESSWFYWFTTYTGPVAATMMQFMTPRIINMYIAFRIVLMCVLWFFGFVMQKIGKPIPPSNDSQPVGNIAYSRNYVHRLPKLGPSSGILRGGGRRRRGGF